MEIEEETAPQLVAAPAAAAAGGKAAAPVTDLSNSDVQTKYR
jgi:hypothetical protein